MYLNTFFTLSVLIGTSLSISPSAFISNVRSCSVRYSDVIKPHKWVCEESQFQAYPTEKVNNLLLSDKYRNAYDYLIVTHNCQKYKDYDQHGNNSYYVFDSICKTVRKEIKVIWAQVPHYTVPQHLMNLNGGLLPCHVIEGQSLYDVECVHPWALGAPPHLSRRMQSRINRMRWDAVTKHLCQVGYNYDSKMFCQPTGYMTREVLVYSEHADMIFTAVVEDVPTSCACSYCNCKNNLSGLPAVV